VSWSQSPSTRSVLSWILFCMPFQYVSPMIHSALGPHDPIPFSITMPAWLLEAFPKNKEEVVSDPLLPSKSHPSSPLHQLFLVLMRFCF
jgi:hypothetical protein